MNNSRPWLLIPMETKVRELHGKLLLGAVAADSGYDVIIGELAEIKSKLRFLPRGIVLEKGVTPPQLKNIRHDRAVGNRVVAWCEEGLVYRNRDAYLRDRISLEAMELVDLFFAWGSVQAEDVLGKAADATEKIVLTGNPRFDLLRPELRGLFRKEANQLKEIHGPYILVPTNFGRVNHFSGAEFVSKVLQARGAHVSQEISEFNRGWTEFLGTVYRAFLIMVPRLARAFPDMKIIVRPHPSENRESWEKALAEVPNVRVIHEGTVIPWIMAAEAVVHNSCTTGIESYLLDVPVIAYRPVKSEVYDSKLPNGVSHQAVTIEELTALIDAIIGGGEVPGFTEEEARRRQVVARRYVSNVDGPWASDRILEALKKVSIAPQGNPVSRLGPMAMKATDIAFPLRLAAARALGRVPAGAAYRRHKFAGLELYEVQMALNQLGEASERFRGLKAEPIPGLKNGYRIAGR